MTEAHFKKLSSDAKILYGLMLDRMSLSMKNGWIDDDNRVFIFFTLDDVQESLSCSHTTGVKILAELDAKTGIGLIERIKQGQGRPTRIYVKNFALPHGCSESDAGIPDFKNVEVKTSKKLKSGLQACGSADFQDVAPSNTNLSNTKKSDTEYQSIYPTAQSPPRKPSQSDSTDMMDAMDTYREIIHENIEYSIHAEHYGTERIDELVQLMLDTICSKRDTVRIDRADYPAEVVKSRLLKLRYPHIEYVLDCLGKTTTKINNIRSYLLTALYNSLTTMDSYYSAAVNHDLYGGT